MARENRGGALFVLGEAGLGKTAVLEEVCRRAGEDMLVARARCDPMETSLPYGLLRQILEGLGGGHEIPTAVAEGADARNTLLYSTLRWLDEAARTPVLIALDDLQWTDMDSLVLLGFLCRRLVHLPVAVVATLRPWPAAAADLAWSLVHRGDATIEHLFPLTEGAAAEVLGEKLGRPCAPGVAASLWRLTGGNPLLLGLAAGALTADTPVATEREGVPLSVIERTLILTRFTGLTSAGMRWAQAAAVLGIEFRPELVGEVAGLDGHAVEAAAEAVWRSGLARESANGLAQFVHPLFGQLLYDDVPAPVRARLHARAFTALAARGSDDLAAEHAARANLAGDARAIEILTETGRRALRAGAPATAASRLEAAVRLAGDADTVPLLAELGQALLEAGRTLDAVSTIEQLLDTELPLAQRVAALTILSRAHFSLGDFDSAAVDLQTAAALAEQECPEAVVAPLCRHASAVMMTAGPAAALPLAARALDLAQGGGERAQAQARATWGLLSFWSGDPAGLEAAESEGRQALRATSAQVAADLRSGVSGVLLPYACVAMFAEHFVDAEAAFRLGIDEAEKAGAVNAAAALAIPHGFMLLRIRLRDSVAVADRLLAVADMVPLAEPFGRTMKSYALLELGEEQQSATERERARAAAAAFDIWLSLLWLEHVQGLRFLRHGRFEEASDVYAELEARYRSLGIGEPCIVPFARHALVAHARSGRTEDAERLVHWLDECAGRLPCRWPAAAAAGGRALLALRRGDRLEADDAYRTAVAHLDGVSLPLEQAELMIEHGTLLRRDRRPRDARESLRRAGELAESVGATWLARRAGEELAAAGGRRRSRRDAQELTPQEQAIARLAATGASDKDIATHLVVSVRTVRTHLEHTYAKLGIHSRRELMAMGERLEAVIGPKG
jgi:DNA-binding CsgD family transcriptional regulator